ncbi:hypothetical protein M9X92_001811 [Pyricularia oryzae]|nr:hypothetical protein M9X92_001811 [Pyricularia oryzae]
MVSGQKVQLAHGQPRAGERIAKVHHPHAQGGSPCEPLLTTRPQLAHIYLIYSVDTVPACPDRGLHRGSECALHPRAVRFVYDAKLLKWLHEAQYFLTDGGVVGVAERVTRIQPGDAVVSLKGASEDSLFAIRQLPPAQQSDHILLNGVYIHFTPEEAEAHKAFVDDLNAGILDTQKITLV